MGLFTRRTGQWKKRFALLPAFITYGPGKDRAIWFGWYYVRWRKSLGAHMVDVAREPVD